MLSPSRAGRRDEAFKRGNWQVSRRTRLHGRTRRRRQSTTFSRPSRPFLRPGRPPSFPPSSAPYLAKSSLPRMKRQRRRTTPRRRSIVVVIDRSGRYIKLVVSQYHHSRISIIQRCVIVPRDTISISTHSFRMSLTNLTHQSSLKSDPVLLNKATRIITLFTII